MNLSAWLRKTPHPVAVTADGKRIEVSRAGGKWRDLVRTIEAMGATKIECLDGQGNITRAITLDEESEGEKTELQSDLQALSRIIADAYEKGTKAPQALLDSAMNFIERQGQRLLTQDREIERLRGLNAKLSAEIMQLKSLPSGEEGDEGIMGALMQGVIQAQAAGATENVTPIAKKGK